MSRSNKDRVKKLRERFFLEQCFAAAGLPLEVLAERETPDFLLRDGRGEVGIELAQVFNDRKQVRADGTRASPGKAIEKQRDGYLAAIATAYYARGGLPIRVSAFLPSRRDFTANRDVLDLPPGGDVVGRLLSERPSRAWERSRIVIEHGVKFDVLALPDEFPKYAYWTAMDNHVGFVWQAPADEVQEVVRAKAEEKLIQCRQACSRVGLLLHADCTFGSGMILWNAELPPISPCGFDEVLLYLHPGEVWRLWPGAAMCLASRRAQQAEAER